MTKPLQGRSILITRSRSQSSEFRRLLEELGARVLELPTIQIQPRVEPELDRALSRLAEYDWLIFTSANGVELFFRRARESGLQTGSLAPSPQVAAIGPATAQRVEQAGLRVSLLPSTYQAEGLLEEFDRRYPSGLAGVRILLPRASRAREILPSQLRRKGAEVEIIPVYDTLVPEESRQLLQGLLEKPEPDLITFTSSSTVHHFIDLSQGRSDLSRFAYAAIGPITAATAREYGLPIVCQPRESTIPALAQAIKEFFAGLS